MNTLIEDNKVFEVQNESVYTGHYTKDKPVLTKGNMTNQISVQLNKNGLQINLVGTIQQVLQHIDEVGANASHVNIPGYYYSKSRSEFLEIATLSTNQLTNILGSLVDKNSKEYEIVEELKLRNQKAIHELKERSL
jgi:hypothetical protein